MFYDSELNGLDGPSASCHSGPELFLQDVWLFRSSPVAPIWTSSPSGIVSRCCARRRKTTLLPQPWTLLMLPLCIWATWFPYGILYSRVETWTMLFLTWGNISGEIFTGDCPENCQSVHFSRYYKIYSWIVLANSNLLVAPNCELTVNWILLGPATMYPLWESVGGKTRAHGCLDCTDSRVLSLFFLVLYTKKEPVFALIHSVWPWTNCFVLPFQVTQLTITSLF